VYACDTGDELETGDEWTLAVVGARLRGIPSDFER
jgi:hypothetical protein